jgi:hypothetical protein
MPIWALTLPPMDHFLHPQRHILHLEPLGREMCNLSAMQISSAWIHSAALESSYRAEESTVLHSGARHLRSMAAVEAMI